MKVKKHITLDKEIIEKAEKKAKEKGLGSLSAYISFLIAEDNKKKQSGLFESITEL